MAATPAAACPYREYADRDGACVERPDRVTAKLRGTWMERQENAREATKKTPEELVLWAIGANDNPLRLNIAKLEFERRVAAAQIETAKSTKSSAQRMLWSVLVLLLTGIFTVVIQ
jgi:hypothetical protein